MKRKRRSLLDEFFSNSIFGDFDELFRRLEREISNLGEGYSISVVSTPEGTRVRVKAGPDVDVAKLRRELEERYPGAIIEIEGGKPLIREVASERVEEPPKSELSGRRSILDEVLGGRRGVLIKEEKDEEN
ncbi:MAG: hypothetical protein NDF55_03310 [archaeon GB-1867-005]|nr:hypothetical protein [Candidatus Culexmicrobium cathedralense]